MFTYYLLMGLTGVLGITKGLALAKILGVTEFGAYGLTVTTGAAFQFIISLGAIDGLNIILPKLMINNDTQEISHTLS